MKWCTALTALIMVISITSCAAPAVETFEVTPSTITAGQSATITWKAQGVSSVFIDPLGSVAVAGMRNVSPAGTTVYTITAGQVSKSIVLTVNPPPINVDFRLDPAMLITNGVAILTWNVTGAASVSIDQGIGPVSSSGNRAVNPTVTTTYTLTATNTLSNVSQSVTLVVNPPIVVSFSVSPSAGYAGQGNVLQWNVAGAKTVTITPDIGDVPASGTRGVFPSTTTTYSLTATSACCSVTKSVAVIIGEQYPYFPYFIYRYPYFGPLQ